MIPTSDRGFAERREVRGNPSAVTALLDRLFVSRRRQRGRGFRYCVREYAIYVPENVRDGAAFNTQPPRRRGRPAPKEKSYHEHGWFPLRTATTGIFRRPHLRKLQYPLTHIEHFGGTWRCKKLDRKPSPIYADKPH